MRLRPLLRRLHWLVGISAGLALAVMGLTGALLEYQPELLAWLNPGVMRSATPFAAADPDHVLAAVRARNPQAAVLSLALARDPQRSARVLLRSGPTPEALKGERRVEYVDPANGRLLGRIDRLRGWRLLHGVESVHRTLGAGAFGKALTGASALVLLYLLGSGLYLRWPRRWTDWRQWLHLDWRRRGRRLWWSLHAVVGAWLLPFYLVSALSGIFFAYDWVRRPLFALAGEARPQFAQPHPTSAAAGPVALDAAWRSFGARVTDWREVLLLPPQGADVPLRLRYLEADAPHERAFGEMRFTAAGRLLASRPYADRNFAGKLIGAMFPLHAGSLFGTPGRILMLLASLTMPMFPLTGWMLYLARRRAQRARLALTARRWRQPS